MITENVEEKTQIVKLTSYTCSDGRTFKNKDDAEEYEKYLDAKEIVKNLKCRTENFIGFEEKYDIAYYCSSEEEFDAVCIVMKYEDDNLQCEDDCIDLESKIKSYDDKGWYYFKIDKYYLDDSWWNYLWQLRIYSLNKERDVIQEKFDEIKKKLDSFNERYSRYFLDEDD